MTERENERERERETAINMERGRPGNRAHLLGHVDVHELVFLRHLLDLSQVLDCWRVDHVDVLLDQGLVLGLLPQLVARHPVLVENTFALRLDLLRTLQGPDRRRHQISVVPDWNVAALLELERRVLIDFPAAIKKLFVSLVSVCISIGTIQLSRAVYVR